MGLLHEKNGKILYAIAYRNPLPKVRFLLAVDAKDALRQILKSRHSLGEIDAVGPAIGGFGKHTERKRLYCFGR